MSGFHRHHPELIGTTADPWMNVRGYPEALREAEIRLRIPNIDEMIERAQRESTHVCTDRDCYAVQAEGDGSCLVCGAPLRTHEP